MVAGRIHHENENDHTLLDPFSVSLEQGWILRGEGMKDLLLDSYKLLPGENPCFYLEPHKDK